MLSPLDVRGAGDDLAARLPRPAPVGDTAEHVEAVRAVLRAVRDGGDAAVRQLTARFDGVDVDEVRVPAAEVTRALDQVDAEVRRALERAHASITAFHRASLTERVVHVHN